MRESRFRMFFVERPEWRQALRDYLRCNGVEVAEVRAAEVGREAGDCREGGALLEVLRPRIDASFVSTAATECREWTRLAWAVTAGETTTVTVSRVGPASSAECPFLDFAEAALFLSALSHHRRQVVTDQLRQLVLPRVKSGPAPREHHLLRGLC